MTTLFKDNISNFYLEIVFNTADVAAKLAKESFITFATYFGRRNHYRIQLSKKNVQLASVVLNVTLAP